MRRREFLGTAALLAGSSDWLRGVESERPESRPLKVASARSLCVAPDLRAAEVGADMLRRGGNAFDALIAAGFFSAVISPAGSGIGGYGGTGIAFDARRDRVVALDANAVAPAAARPDMFPVITKPDSLEYQLPGDDHRKGPRSVAVPGVLAGLLTWLDRYGTLDRQTIIAPAIQQARAGVPLPKEQARAWLEMQARADGRPLPVDMEIPDVVPMTDLADSLQAISEEGADVFYSGRIGRAIVDHLSQRGGLLSPDDFAAYRAVEVEAVSVELARQRLYAPPPSSGGLTSLQMTALYDRATRSGDLPRAGSAEALELLLEIDKVVWAERLTTLADPGAMSVAPQSLLNESHLDELLARVRAGLANPTPGRLIAADPLRGTVHLLAADESGNLVSWTQTHGGGFGSGVLVPGTGIVLGHGMCRFEPRPGWANSIAPGKRPLHNMCPLLALAEGRPVFAAGAAGGRTIVNNSAALAIHRLVEGMDAGGAVAAPRMQCESLEPGIVESAVGHESVQTLRARGHQVSVVERDAGTAHLIVRESDRWVGAAEPRNPRAAVAVGSD